MQKREVMQDTAADGAEADGDKARAGIQSVEVGFALLQVLAQGPGAWMLRDLAALRRVMLAGTDETAADRRGTLEAISAPGRPFRPLAHSAASSRSLTQ